MKIKNLSIVGIAALSIVMSACPATTNTNTTNTNKPAANTVNSVNNSTNSSAPTVEGSVVKIEDAGIEMIVPKGFKFSKDGEDTVVTTEDGGVEVVFHVPADGDYAKAVKDAAKELDDYIKDAKFDKQGEKSMVGGMEVVTSSGSGKDDDGKNVLFDLTIFNSPKKPVLAVTYAEEASMKKYSADLDKFFKSVKKSQ